MWVVFDEKSRLKLRRLDMLSAEEPGIQRPGAPGPIIARVAPRTPRMAGKAGPFWIEKRNPRLYYRC
jgi:hypothetical protein